MYFALTMRLQWTLARVPLLGVVVVQRLVLSVKLVASVKGGQVPLKRGVKQVKATTTTISITNDKRSVQMNL